MNKEKYVLGLDIGISSVGWGMLRLDDENNPVRVIDAGVKIFSPGEVPKTGASKNLSRRTKRGSRRITRRREFRVDRIRNLLNLNGYLGNEIVEGVVSEVNEKLTNIFNEMTIKYYKGKDITPYHLKVDALDRKLDKDELCIILVHYAKHRGYKSNRDEDLGDSENGKVKSAILVNQKIMKDNNYRIVSEMFIKDSKFNDRIRNSSGDYRLSVTREMYLQEINMVLDKQIELGLITEDFKTEYITIWSSQRHYAKGPGGDSKYGGDLIARMTGKCKFDGEPRAPKFAASSEIFVALTILVNLRYKDGRADEYKKLEANQINDIIELAKEKDVVTYKNIFEYLNLTNGVIKGLIATKSEKAKAINLFKKKAEVDEFDYENFDEQQREFYDQLKLNEISKRCCISLKNYSVIRKTFSKFLGVQKWEEISSDYELLDLIAKILTDYKLDEDVIEAIKQNNIDEIYTEAILELPNFKDHNMLSSSLIRKLNVLMLKGMTYDVAMAELGYSHSELVSENEKEDLLIPINQDEELNNQRVIRSLSQARGIINSIIKKYGMPERINIETARELSKSREERNEIAKRRDENKEMNERQKELLVEKGLFTSVDKVKKHDLLKYRLWEEQLGKCPYSLESIPVEYLFDDNLVQVDHILPYSRTFDDSYYNKTLVLSKYNQEKRNMTPFEWFGNTEKWNDFKGFISNLDISERKKENYLLSKLTIEMESEYRNQNLNDTKFISKYLVSYIKANLNVAKVGCPSGSITGKLRNYWHLNGLTHSLESEIYYVLNDGNEAKKNRNNHLHHAMDALIIASANDTVIRRVSNYERYKRYLDNQPLDYILNYVKNITENFDVNTFVDENGEVLEDSLKSYVKDLRENEYFINKKNKTIKTFVPEPYEGFANEAKIRVYEQSKDIMNFKLKEFNYSKNDLENSIPIIPKFEKNKISGSLHGGTYYSLRTRKSGDNEIVSKVSRIDIASDSFNEKKLEDILDKEAGSKDVYETVKKWLGKNNGSKAFKDHGGYPINPKTGNAIKKIRIEMTYDGKGHMIGTKLTDKEGICKIDILKKKNEAGLYFIAYDAFDLLQLKKSINIDVDVWWGQGKNHKIYKYNDLFSEFEHVVLLSKNDLIEIELNNGKKGKGYVVGCSSGLFQISSILGDGFDLVGNDNLFNKYREQFQITVSTIKNIKVLKINNLGKIE